MEYDVIIVGGGIVGCAAAYTLSRYELRVLLLERENDVACGTTRANSAIVHAGYDPKPGSVMARMNVRGNELIRELCKKLDVRFCQNGSLVLAFTEENLRELGILYDRGICNGVPGLELWSAEKTLEAEPALNPEIKGALWAPTAGIVDPWGLCLALAQTAVVNGAEILCSHPVTAVTKTTDGFTVEAGGERFTGRFMVNAAGLYADRVHAMIGGSGFALHPDKGAYYLLDKSQGALVSRVIFQCPTPKGKGVLVSPTVHGNLIVGPDAVPGEDRDDVSVQAESLAYIREMAAMSVKTIDYRDAIRNFAGNRARGCDDFVLEASPEDSRFINLAGIQSPGLSSAPAIAEEAARLLEKAGLKLVQKAHFTDTRRQIRFKELSREEQEALIRENPLYGRVICRCETITEGEIVDALRAPLPPRTIDGVKRRCGSGMGRCQGGFCGPRVHAILARELHLPMEAVEKDQTGSYVVLGETKKGAVR